MTSPSPEKQTRPAGSVRRPLFNRPKWAKSTSGGDEEIFRRSGRTYADVAAEKARKQQKKLAKRASEIDERSAHQSPKKSTLPERYSDGVSQGGSDTESETNPLSPQQQAPPQAPEEMLRQKQRSSPLDTSSLLKNYEATIARANTVVKPKLGPHSADVIDLEEDSEVETTIVITNPEELKVQPTEPQPPSESVTLQDEEFPELARRAREKARRRWLEQDMLPHSETPKPNTDREMLALGEEGALPITAAPRADPTIQILITSGIEGTRPLIVSRKLSQRLKDVRLAWIEYQEPRQFILDRCLLTWKGKRLFDVTSCKSLGIKIDEEGSIGSKGDILGYEEGRLHMVAMTTEIFEAYKKAKESQQQYNEQNDEEQEKPAQLHPQTEPIIRIILRAKNIDDVKLIVKPTTLVSKVLNAFRTSRKIQPEKEVFLQFDGERLENGRKIEDTEITDMDHIDVYIK